MSKNKKKKMIVAPNGIRTSDPLLAMLISGATAAGPQQPQKKKSK